MLAGGGSGSGNGGGGGGWARTPGALDQLDFSPVNGKGRSPPSSLDGKDRDGDLGTERESSPTSHLDEERSRGGGVDRRVSTSRSNGLSLRRSTSHTSESLGGRAGGKGADGKGAGGGGGGGGGVEGGIVVANGRGGGGGGIVVANGTIAPAPTPTSAGNIRHSSGKTQSFTEASEYARYIADKLIAMPAMRRHQATSALNPIP